MKTGVFDKFIGKFAYMARFFGVFGALMGLIWVILGALGAHLFTLTASAQQRFDLALRMLIVHALVLIVLGTQQNIKHLPIRMLAGFAFAIGMILFCSSLMALALGAPPYLSKLAPLGGLLLMLGWGLWGLSLLRRSRLN